MTSSLPKVILGLTFAAFCLQSGANAAPWVTAYYPSYEIGTPPISGLNLSAITDLVFFQLVPTTAGALSDPNGGIDSNASALATEVHGAGKKVLICIGGGQTEPTFAKVLASSTLRTTFINNIVSWVSTYGFDGVDIDDEPLGASDGPNYETFITSLHTALPSGDLLTAAAEPYGYPSYFDAVQSSFNQINIMTYDLSGPSWTGYTWYNSNLYSEPASVDGTSPTSCVQALQNYTGAGIPASKLSIGAAFYGYLWNNATTTAQTVSSGDGCTAYSYASIMSDYYTSSAYHWDGDADAPYLSLTSADEWVSYDDTTLCADKVDYVVNNALGGLVIFEIGQDYMSNGTQPLLTAIYNELVLDNGLGGSAPSAPTGLTAAAGTGQVSLSWTGSSGATSYNVYRGTTAGGESSTPITTGLTGTSYTNTGLTAGTAYYYKVAAVDGSGTSGMSNEASATPTGSAPAAPTGLTATAGNAQAALAWTGSSGATSYDVYRGTSSGGELSTPVVTGVTSTSYTNTGLTNGTAYYFKVAAVDSSGTSGMSNEASATPMSGSSNIAPSGTGYTWDKNSSATSNSNRTACPGVNDANLTASNVINSAGEGGSAKWEGAGVVWSSTHTVSSVVFINGNNDGYGNGFFQSNVELQLSTNGTTWTNSGWSVSPAYPDTSAAWGQTYTFSGTAQSGIEGVRVVGETGSTSWSGSVIELEAVGQ